MAYTLLVQQLRGAGITEDALRKYLDGTTAIEYLAAIEADKGRADLEKALDRWNTDF